MVDLVNGRIIALAHEDENNPYYSLTTVEMTWIFEEYLEFDDYCRNIENQGVCVHVLRVEQFLSCFGEGSEMGKTPCFGYHGK